MSVSFTVFGKSTPRRSPRASTASPSVASLASGKMTSPAGSGAASTTLVNRSALRPDASISGMQLSLEGFAEGCDAETPIGFDEGFAGGPAREIDVDDLLDRLRHFLGREPRAQALAERCMLGGVAAERELVIFGAVLLEAENADMANMVMAASIDAARDLDAERADLALARAIGEAPRDRLRDRDR